MEDAQDLKNMARELENTEFDRHERIQKTFVISRRSLSFLDTISRNNPRGTLWNIPFEGSCRLLQKEKNMKRKELIGEIAYHFEKGRRLLSKAEEMLHKMTRLSVNCRLRCPSIKTLWMNHQFH